MVEAIIGVIYKEEPPVMDQGGRATGHQCGEEMFLRRRIGRLQIASSKHPFQQHLLRNQNTQVHTPEISCWPLIALDIWIMLTRCFLKHWTYLRKNTSRCGPHQNHKSSQTQWRWWVADKNLNDDMSTITTTTSIERRPWWRWQRQ